MNRDYFVDLFTYTDWANRRVWNCAMQASDDDYFKEQTFSVGSIYIQLLHTLVVERWWVHFLATGDIKLISEDEVDTYKDRDRLRQLWDETQQANMQYVQLLTDEELQRTVKPPFWEDDEGTITVAQALAQVINHSIDHRAQIMAVLHTMGYDGIGQDYLTYLREMTRG